MNKKKTLILDDINTFQPDLVLTDDSGMVLESIFVKN
jgi:predicted glycosyltransferase